MRQELNYVGIIVEPYEQFHFLGMHELKSTMIFKCDDNDLTFVEMTFLELAFFFLSILCYYIMQSLRIFPQGSNGGKIFEGREGNFLCCSLLSQFCCKLLWLSSEI